MNSILSELKQKQVEREKALSHINSTKRIFITCPHCGSIYAPLTDGANITGQVFVCRNQDCKMTFDCDTEKGYGIQIHPERDLSIHVYEDGEPNTEEDTPEPYPRGYKYEPRLLC